jgi:hypothetical protein
MGFIFSCEMGGVEFFLNFFLKNRVGWNFLKSFFLKNKVGCFFFKLFFLKKGGGGSNSPPFFLNHHSVANYNIGLPMFKILFFKPFDGPQFSPIRY